jgi:HEAT repeat protein
MASSVTSGRKAFERKVEGLQALRGADSQTARAALGAALRDRNNFLVARAAGIVAELRADALVPDLVAAFERFFVDPVKSDPHCLAKLAIAKALRELGHREAETFVRGVAHIQLEPAWGGRADTAAELRGTCLLALSETTLGDLQILSYLVDGLADPDSLVRTNAAMAIEQLNREEGALVLRLKLLIGDREPDVAGQCFTSYLSLAPQGAVSFVARFLRAESEDVQIEAASALAQSRDPQAIQILSDFWRDERVSIEVRRALLINLGASTLREAAEFLLNVVGRESVDLASTAVSALATGRYRAEMEPRVADLVAQRDSSTLSAQFAEQFGR